MGKGEHTPTSYADPEVAGAIVAHRTKFKNIVGAQQAAMIYALFTGLDPDADDEPTLRYLSRQLRGQFNAIKAEFGDDRIAQHIQNTVTKAEHEARREWEERERTEKQAAH